MRNSEMQFAYVSFQKYMEFLQAENDMPMSVKGKCHLTILLQRDLLRE
jgi:hypothetical protein